MNEVEFTSLNPELAEIGALLRELPPAQVQSSAVNEDPPTGAARFLRREGAVFEWAPVREDEWRSIDDGARGQIICERMSEWLLENGSTRRSKLVPIRGPRNEVHLFGDGNFNLKDALCLVYRWLRDNEITVEVAMLLVGEALAVASGIPLMYLTPHLFRLLLSAAARRFCRD